MKRLNFLPFLLALVATVGVVQSCVAQTATDPNEGSRLTLDTTTGGYDFSWWGHSGRTYFIQQTDDLLTSWNYLPVIESGVNDVLQWGFISTNDKFFLRLRYSDIATSDPFNADFDGDKVSNQEELNYGTDPLHWADFDLDGMPDDWEIRHGLDPNDAYDAALDQDDDGFTNLQEYLAGNDPNDHFNGMPTPPVLQAQSLSPSLVQLTWIAGDPYGILAFSVERYYPEFSYGYEIARLSASSTAHLEDYLWQGETYSYRVGAIRENSATAFSNVVTVTMPSDSDYDGLSDADEAVWGTDPDDWDSDGDGMPDGWEVTHNLDPNFDDSEDDDDGDGVDNIDEYYSGGNPNNADSDGDGVSDGREEALGMSPTSTDSDGDGIQDGREVILTAEVVGVNGYKHGFDTYQTTTPPKRYLREFVEWTNLIGGNPESGPIGIGPGTFTRNIDPITGEVTTQNTGVGGGYYPTTGTSPTTAHDTFDVYGYDDPPNQENDEPGTVNADGTLSIEHTTDTLKQNTVTRMPAFQNEFTPVSWGDAAKDLSEDELSFDIEKMQYKFQFGAHIDNITLDWLEIWVPEDDPDTATDESKAIEVEKKTWTGSGTESPTYTIDVHTKKPNADGHFLVIAPPSPRSKKLYMFSGHSSDLIPLSVTAPDFLDWEWRIPNDTYGVLPYSAERTRDEGTYSAFRAGFEGGQITIPGDEWEQAPGTTKIELYAGTHKITDWDVEILDIHPRGEWGPNAPRLGEMEGMPNILGATFHHSNRSGDGPNEIRAIQDKHQERPSRFGSGKGYADIAYHFAMTKDGTIYEARQLEQLRACHALFRDKAVLCKCSRASRLG